MFDLSPDLDGIALDMALLELELPVRSNGITAACHSASRRPWR
jgi:hypothetical protein